MTKPSDLAEKQLLAYNAHDLEAFCACFSDDVVVELLQDNQVLFTGKDALRSTYAERFSHPDLHAHLLNRMALGRVVIDEEEVTGLPGGSPLYVLAIYEIEEGLIRRVRFERGERGQTRVQVSG
ncbi:nuclear transport factor 2 family protein [Kiloniella laminariae]|uniref:nuclear transport factor 2 family protein n=1 Tax=Kiloniella laminariae TaxID=454162 RepID=UPI0003825BDB|nr:nuclear transport factor 2 family protein [Kiloniella laminariae]